MPTTRLTACFFSITTENNREIALLQQPKASQQAYFSMSMISLSVRTRDVRARHDRQISNEAEKRKEAKLIDVRLASDMHNFADPNTSPLLLRRAGSVNKGELKRRFVNINACLSAPSHIALSTRVIGMFRGGLNITATPPHSPMKRSTEQLPNMRQTSLPESDTYASAWMEKKQRDERTDTAHMQYHE